MFQWRDAEMGRKSDAIFTTVRFSDEQPKYTIEEAHEGLMNFMKYIIFEMPDVDKLQKDCYNKEAHKNLI